MSREVRFGVGGLLAAVLSTGLLPFLPGCGDEVAPTPPEPECTAQRPCPGRHLNCVNDRCVQADPAVNGQCPPGLVNENNLCVQYCTPIWCAVAGAGECNNETHRCERTGEGPVCTRQEDCPQGFACDVRERKCRPVECEDDARCRELAGLAPDAGIPENFRGRLHCAENLCRECTDNTHCDELYPGEGRTCEGYACQPRVVQCESDEDCVRTDGLRGDITCNLSTVPHRCEEPATCDSLGDCLDGRYCKSTTHTCDDPCQNDDDCLPGTCNPTTRECEDRVRPGECSNDTDCRVEGTNRLNSWKCRKENGEERGRCVGCLDALDCPGGAAATCNPASHQCMPPDPCGTDDDCSLWGFVCEADRRYNYERATCQRRCDQGRTCLGGTSCNPRTGHCEGGPVGCRSSVESCRENEVCDPATGQCRVKAAGECRTRLDCPAAQRCVGIECSAPYTEGLCVADVECGGRGDCGVRWGACVFGACQQDGDCPAGLFCVDGACQGCTPPDDQNPEDTCPGEQVCAVAASGLYLACSESPWCELDEDCLGDRVCEPNVRTCVAADECPGEDRISRAEVVLPGQDQPVRGNHDRRSAVEIGPGTLPGLHYCDGRPDWFKVRLDPGKGLRATIHFDPADGDLRLTLYDDRNRVVRRSDLLAGAEQVGVGAADVTRQAYYYLEVSGAPGVSVDYWLDVEVDASICMDDALEGPDGNDESSTAAPVGANEYPDLVICPGDQDFYAVDVAPGTELTVCLTYGAEGEGAVRVALFDPRNRPLQPENQPSADGLCLRAAGLDGGRHLILVTGAGANDRLIHYDLLVNYRIGRAGQEAKCRDAELLQYQWEGPAGQERARITFEGNTGIPVINSNAFIGSCALNPERHTAPEKLYRLRLDATADVSVQAQAIGEFGLMVYLKAHAGRDDDGCWDPNDELRCYLNPRVGRPLSFGVLPAGDYLLVVDGVDNGRGPFQVQIDLARAADPPPGDSCRDPIGLVLQALPGEETLRGQSDATTTDARADDFTLSCVPHDGPDIVFSFQVPRNPRGIPYDLVAKVRPTNHLAGFAVRPVCGGQAELGCQYRPNMVNVEQTLLVDRIPEGQYFLVVEGDGPIQDGDVHVEVELVPDDVQREGDRCDGPKEFEVAELRNDGAVFHGESWGETFGARPDLQGGRCALPGWDVAAGADVVHHFRLDRQAVTFRLTFQADFDAIAYLRRGNCLNGEEVGCTLAGGNIDLHNVPPADYYLIVDGRNGDPAEAMGGWRASLDAVLVEPAECDRCGAVGCTTNPPVLGPRPPVDAAVWTGNTTPAGNDYAPVGCGGDAGGQEAVGSFVVQEELQLTATVIADFQPVVYLRTGPGQAACEDGQEVACRAGDQLGPVFLRPGTYYLFVDGASADQHGDFQVFLQAREPPPQPPPHDSCAGVPEPIDLLVEGNVATGQVAGTTQAARDDSRPRQGCVLQQGGADVVYFFDLPRVADVTVTTQAEFLAATSLWRAGQNNDCATAQELACTIGPQFRLRDLPPGRYYLWMDGVDAANKGRFRIDIRADLKVVPPVNDTCQEPYVLQWANVPGDPEGRQVAQSAAGQPTSTTLVANADYAGAQACGLLDRTRDGRDVVFRFDLPGPDPSEVRARVTTPQGGVAWDSVLYIRARDCEGGQEVGCVDDGWWQEGERGVLLDPGTYFAFVDGYSANDKGAFILTVERIPRRQEPPPPHDTCSVDPNAEPPLGPRVLEFDEGGFAVVADALLENTRWARPDYQGGLACALDPRLAGTGKDVVYTFTLDEASHLEVAFQPEFDGVIYLRAGDCANGEELACDAFTGAFEVRRLDPGTYYLIVDGQTPADWGPFTLQLYRRKALEAPPNDSCLVDAGHQPPLGPIDVQLDRNGLATLEVTEELFNELARDDYDGSCGGGGAPDVVYRITPDRAAVLNVTSRFAGFRPRFYVRTRCDRRDSELACGEDSLTTAPLPANQPVYLIVDGRGPRDHGYQLLDIQLTPVPLNDRCPGSDLPIDDLHPNASPAGNTIAAGDHYSGSCGGQGGKDVVYALHLEDQSDVRITIRSEWQSRLYVRTAACDGQNAREVVCSDNGRILLEGNNSLPRGDYWIVVDGANAQAAGGFQLRVEILGLSPGNDLCEAAFDLELGAGRQVAQGTTLFASDDHAGGQCGGRGGGEVFYAFSLGEPKDVRATIEADTLDPQGAAYVLNLLEGGCNGAVTACSAGRSFCAPQVPAGDHILSVDTANADTELSRFDLVLETPRPRNTICAYAETHDLAPEAGLDIPVDLCGSRTENEDTGGCPEGANTREGRDLVYELNLSAPLEWLEASVDSPDMDSEVIFFRKESCYGGRQFGCVGEGGTIRTGRLKGGTHYLILDSGQADRVGTATIHVTAGPEAQCNPNDTCDSPEVIEGDLTREEGEERGVTVQGSTLGCTSDYGESTCRWPEGSRHEVDRAPDVVFQFTAPAVPGVQACMVTATVPEGETYIPIVYVRQGNCQNGNEVACGWNGVQVFVRPGTTYFAFVDGIEATQVGDFSLNVACPIFNEAIECNEQGQCPQGMVCVGRGPNGNPRGTCQWP